MDRPTIHVRGYAVVPARPDEARIRFAVSTLKAKANDAHEDAAKKVQAISNVLDALIPDEESRTTDTISVSEEWDHRNNRDVLSGYSAETALTVHVTDFDIVGQLVRDALNAAEAKVTVAWHIDRDNPARAEACRLAGVDARRRAEAYTNALGARVGMPVHVDEDSHGPYEIGNANDELRAPLTLIKGMAKLLRNNRGREAKIEFEPGDLAVQASINVRFQLEPPSS